MHRQSRRYSEMASRMPAHLARVNTMSYLTSRYGRQSLQRHLGAVRRALGAADTWTFQEACSRER